MGRSTVPSDYSALNMELHKIAFNEEPEIAPRYYESWSALGVLLNKILKNQDVYHMSVQIDPEGEQFEAGFAMDDGNFRFEYYTRGPTPAYAMAQACYLYFVDPKNTQTNIEDLDTNGSMN